MAGDAYERKIVLKSGGNAIGEILLGTSPAFKQISARAGDDSHVYSVAFAEYEAGTRGDDWMDRTLLNIPQDQIVSIATGDVTLERKDGKFVLSGLVEGQKPDETAIYRLVGALTYPVFDSVVGKGAEALAKVNEPNIEVTVKRTSGAPIVLKYKKEAAGGAYVFASSATGFLFRASEAAIEPIAKAKHDALIEAPKKAEQSKKAEDSAAAIEPVKAEEAKGEQDEAVQPAPPPAKPDEAQKAEGADAQPVTGKTGDPAQTPGGG